MQKNTGAAHSEGRGGAGGWVGVGEACACLISSPISFPSALPPLLPFFPQFTFLSIKPKTQPKHPPTFLFSFFYFFFFQAGEPLPGFPFWCFVEGPVVNLRLRRPRELGDRAFRMVASPPNEERAIVPPSCLAKEIL